MLVSIFIRVQDLSGPLTVLPLAQVLDKNPFFGGNSTKATSGINGAGTKAVGARRLTGVCPELTSTFALVASRSRNQGQRQGLL